MECEAECEMWQLCARHQLFGCLASDEANDVCVGVGTGDSRPYN